jgi:hypothetical protein
VLLLGANTSSAVHRFSKHALLVFGQ